MSSNARRLPSGAQAEAIHLDAGGIGVCVEQLVDHASGIGEILEAVQHRHASKAVVDEVQRRDDADPLFVDELA